MEQILGDKHVGSQYRSSQPAHCLCISNLSCSLSCQFSPELLHTPQALGRPLPMPPSSALLCHHGFLNRGLAIAEWTKISVFLSLASMADISKVGKSSGAQDFHPDSITARCYFLCFSLSSPFLNLTKPLASNIPNRREFHWLVTASLNKLAQRSMTRRQDKGSREDKCLSLALCPVRRYEIW